jgi:hypothetical protein
VKEVDIFQSGVFALEFSDGATFEWEFPTIAAFGIIQWQRSIVLKGPVVVRDTLNDLTLEIQLGPKPDRTKGITKQRHSQLYGGIADGKGKLSTTVTGDYARAVVVDGMEVWNIDRNIAHRPTAGFPDELMLPSDSRYRLDRMMLIKKDLEAADAVKVTIEETQRREKKLRR